MRRTITSILVVALAFVTGGPGIRETEARAAGSPDVVLEWNQLLQATIPSTASLAAPRFYSMMHIAMFDAANSVEREYHAYRIELRHASGASPEAAAAQAAHDVLVALLPASQTVYDAALTARLNRVPRGR